MRFTEVRFWAALQQILLMRGEICPRLYFVCILHVALYISMHRTFRPVYAVCGLCFCRIGLNNQDIESILSITVGLFNSM